MHGVVDEGTVVLCGPKVPVCTPESACLIRAVQQALGVGKKQADNGGDFPQSQIGG